MTYNSKIKNPLGSSLHLNFNVKLDLNIKLLSNLLDIQADLVALRQHIKILSWKRKVTFTSSANTASDHNKLP